MRYESEKQRKVRERQREKKEKERQDEDKILQHSRNKSKVIPRQVAEDVGVRMYKDAQRRQVKSQSRQDQTHLISSTGRSTVMSNKSKISGNGHSNIGNMNDYDYYANSKKNQQYVFQVFKIF